MAVPAPSAYVPVPTGYVRPGGARPLTQQVAGRGRGGVQSIIDGGAQWGNIAGLKSSADPLKRFLCAAFCQYGSCPFDDCRYSHVPFSAARENGPCINMPVGDGGPQGGIEPGQPAQAAAPAVPPAPAPASPAPSPQVQQQQQQSPVQQQQQNAGNEILVEPPPPVAPPKEQKPDPSRELQSKYLNYSGMQSGDPRSREIHIRERNKVARYLAARTGAGSLLFRISIRSPALSNWFIRVGRSLHLTRSLPLPLCALGFLECNPSA